MFTQSQKQLLKEASSKLKPDDLFELPQDIIDTVVARIDAVTIELHMQNPNALLTTLKVSSKGKATIVDSKERLAKRRFFDVPLSLASHEYASAVSHEPRPLRLLRKVK